ncbi:MAG TPA: hypothetical protein PL155_08510 [Candidatus Omnitrophota bacterium]|nr:hypothetical protein [Candidatus Omnitrophota bacterium]HPD85504.1 hypothetical protein [Candidatus Omnitrophota bacterium]HRZ03995.1 hypothetical protein [Candidatus Omnitrophota bacterium]
MFTRLDGSGFRLVYPVIRLPHGLMVESFCPIDKETALDLTNAVVDKIDKIAKGSKRGPESTYYVPYLDE